MLKEYYIKHFINMPISRMKVTRKYVWKCIVFEEQSMVKGCYSMTNDVSFFTVFISGSYSYPLNVYFLETSKMIMTKIALCFQGQIPKWTTAFNNYDTKRVTLNDYSFRNNFSNSKCYKFILIPFCYKQKHATKTLRIEAFSAFLYFKW